MFTALRRHPIPIDAYFRHSLVMAFAFPEEKLRPLLSPGLVLDTYEGQAFLAIALVQTESLRYAGLPKLFGRDFFLSGYRIFTRFKRPDGKISRGLKILRSDVDDRLMVWGGNLLTHYGYRKCAVQTCRTSENLEIDVKTPNGEADFSVRAHIARDAESPPAGSPFPDLATARRFAGPLPYTFGHEPETGSMVIVQGVHRSWKPRPVDLEWCRSSYLRTPPFDSVPMRLANAFFMEGIPYHWKRGEVAPIPDPAD
jgi:hypothetical protein